MSIVTAVADREAAMPTNRERATEFVKRYPGLFTEDFDFWSAELGALLEEACTQARKEERDWMMATFKKALARVRARE